MKRFALRAGSEVRRITKTHALTMVVVSALVVTNLLARWDQVGERTSGGIMILDLLILGAVTLGAAIGGSLVFDKGYKVRARMTPPATSERVTDSITPRTGNLVTKEVIMARTQEMTAEQQDKKDEQMCCEGGMTAVEHRAQSPDGKCCTD